MSHNQLMPGYRRELLLGNQNWALSTVRCLALTIDLEEADIDSSTYVYVADLPEADVLDVPSDALTNMGVSDLGVAECSDAVFTGLTSGSREVRSLLFYVDTGDSLTDLLIAYMPVATGLPFTAGGGVTTISRQLGENGFFRV